MSGGTQRPRKVHDVTEVVDRGTFSLLLVPREHLKVTIKNCYLWTAMGPLPGDLGRKGITSTQQQASSSSQSPAKEEGTGFLTKASR